MVVEAAILFLLVEEAPLIIFIGEFKPLSDEKNISKHENSILAPQRSGEDWKYDI